MPTVVLLLISLADAATGCSLIIEPVTKFDPREYVFAGEVLDYVGPRKSKHVVGDVWGLLVKPDASIHLPKTPAKFFEVFTYDLEPDCSFRGTSREDLAENFPAGSEVHVIARESKLIRAGAGNIALADSPGGNGLVAKASEPGGGVSAAPVYDYRSYRGDQSAIPALELRRDLMRLRDARTAAERIAVLERLVYFPWAHYLDYAKAAQLYLKDRKAVARLVGDREAWLRRRQSSAR